jgi:hypothetical protein
MRVVPACHVFAFWPELPIDLLEVERSTSDRSEDLGGSMIRAGFETTDPRTQTRTAVVD